jgi:hypothetical protein
MTEEEICSSSHSLKLTTAVRGCLVIVLAGEGAEVHLRAPQTKNEHFWQCARTNCHLEKLNHCWETSKPQDAPGYLKCPLSHWQ